MTFIRRWWFLGAALLSLGGWAARLQAELDAKASRDDVVEMRRDLIEIKQRLSDMDARQRAYFCRNQGEWCR